MDNAQHAMIMQHLETHGSITPREAEDYYGVMRLSAIIFILRHRGVNIRTIMEHGRNRFGRPSRWARYKLIKESNNE